MGVGGGELAGMSSPAKVPVGLLVKLGLVAIAVIVVAVLVLRGVDVRGLIDQVFALVREAGPWAFFGSMAVLPAVGFPISPFYLTAGEAFAGQMTMPGVLAAALVANSVQFALSFWLAQRAFRPVVEWLLAQAKYRVPQVKPENETTVAVLVRVTPGPPLCMQSYLLALSGVRFRTYLWVSIAVQGLMGSAYIVFGKALMSGKGGLALLGLMVLVFAIAAVQLVRKRLAQRDAGAV